MAIVESAVRRKLEAMYGARADLVHTRATGTPGPAGEVLVFELHGHPTARFCDVWEGDGRVVTSLR